MENNLFDFSQIISELYGQEYLDKAQEQKTSEILTYSLLKILSGASPFVNFTTEMFLDDNKFLKSMEYVVKACIKISKDGFKEFLKEQLGIFSHKYCRI